MHMDRTSCNAEKLVWQQESRTIKSPAVKIKREKGKSTAIISDVSLLQNSHQTLSWRHSLGQEARVSSAAVKGTSERSQVEPARRIAAPALPRYPPVLSILRASALFPFHAALCRLPTATQTERGDRINRRGVGATQGRARRGPLTERLHHIVHEIPATPIVASHH